MRGVFGGMATFMILFDSIGRGRLVELGYGGGAEYIDCSVVGGDFRVYERIGFDGIGLLMD